MAEPRDIQKQFEGFCSTPLLWTKELEGITQFNHFPKNSISFQDALPRELLLGKRVEQYLSFLLDQDINYKIILEGAQIISDGITKGELDMIVAHQKNIYHLEVAYKFYLYDATVGTTHLEHWIGPNRKDSLIEKLVKIREKQFPLLHLDPTQALLQEYNLVAEQILQRTLFKAQLFLPYGMEMEQTPLNPESIRGHYLSFDQMDRLPPGKIYIPEKTDWLITPHPNVNWQSYEKSRVVLADYMKRTISKLCWVKSNNGEISSVFITWWE